MNIAPSIQVNVRNQINRKSFALITKAEQRDMPDNWQCNWVRLYESLEEKYYESIVKIQYRDSLLGLMKYTFYPDPPEQVEFIEINNLEALPQLQRQTHPVGRWLIWYVCNLAINYCPTKPSSQILFLNSVEEAFTFYKDTIRMECMEQVTLGPRENGYAFRFNRQNALQFCKDLETTYGCPTVLSDGR